MLGNLLKVAMNLREARKETITLPRTRKTIEFVEKKADKKKSSIKGVDTTRSYVRELDKGVKGIIARGGRREGRRTTHHTPTYHCLNGDDAGWRRAAG